jgi:hypothetical protein
MNAVYCERTQTELSAEQILNQLERILQSRHFRQARGLEKFLRHVVTTTLAEAANELKEYSIGVDVFQRRKSFDPRTDAVVRVQATQLRKKLAGYYEAEGATDEIIIELPKGHYVPVFSRREPDNQSLVVSEPGALATFDIEPTPRVQDWPLATDALAPAARRFNWWPTAAAFALGVLVVLIFQHWRGSFIPAGDNAARAQATAQPDPVYQPLWEKFLEPGVNTVLAYGTPQFFQFNGFYLRDVRVNSPAEVELAAGARLLSVQREFNTPLQPVEVYTGVGEAHGIHTLSRFFWQQARDLQVARSRLVGWQEVKNSNLIFLSSMRFHTLADELGYPNDFAINPDVQGVVINRRPQPGEEKEYGHAGDAYTSYAVVTLWPGRAEKRRIMLLSGSNTWATLAAAEYATGADSLRQLKEQLAHCNERAQRAVHPPYFQILVRAEVKDNQPVSIAYVTHHDLEIAGLSETTPLSARLQRLP